jgi:hypothetical protein
MISAYDAWGLRLPGGAMACLDACYDGMFSTISVFVCSLC